MPPALFTNMKKTAFVLVIAAIIVCLAIFPRTKPSSMKFFAMDTIVEITSLGDEKVARTAVKAASDEIARIDKELGYGNSELEKLNESGSSDNDEIFRLVEKSLSIYEKSDGGFSITLRPVLEEWGFTGAHPFRVPEKNFMDSWSCSDEDIVLSEGCVHTPVKIDLGGIAKGYAADMATRAMIEAGADSGLVNAGGDIRAFGGRTWKIGIQNPRGEGIIATIPIRNRAVATSGDYERFFVEDDVRYCHILDPSTGYPARRYISVTVIAKSCMEADAWTTAVFVKGIEDLGTVLDSAGMEWIIVEPDGLVRSSCGIRKHCPERISID